MCVKELTLGTIRDLVSNLLYYDRKEDEELPRGAIEGAVERGDLTVDEMVAAFRLSLEKGLPSKES